MLKLKHLLENVWFHQRNFSKKMYTTGLMLFSGIVVVAIVMLGVNGFASTKHTDITATFEKEDDDIKDDPGVEELIANDVADESSSSYSHDVSELIDELNSVKSQVPYINEIGPVLAIYHEEVAERNFRAEATSIEEVNMTLLGSDDYTALVRIVEAEATGEDIIGKILIANVVLNRVESKRFPNSIYDVVHQSLDGKAQFSPIDDGRYYSVRVTDSSVEAVERALSGEDYSEGALFFVAKSLASEKAGSWFDRHLEFLFKHGVHSFYKY